MGGQDQSQALDHPILRNDRATPPRIGLIRSADGAKRRPAAIQLTGAARSLQGIGVRGIKGRNPVRNTLLWIFGIGVTFGIGCILANAVLWWRNYVKRRPGAGWWTRI